MTTIRNNTTAEIHVVAATDGYDMGPGTNQWATIPDQTGGLSPEEQSYNGTAWVQTMIKAPTLKTVCVGIHGILPNPASGTYLSAALNASALVTIAAASNRLDLVPFIPADNISIEEFAIEVTTLLAASNARIGVYGADAAGLPGNLVASSGLLSCATAGAKVWAPGMPVYFKKGGIYWIAVLMSGTFTLRGIPLAALLPIGHAATGTAVNVLRRATQTFASGMPALPPGQIATSAIAPWVRMKIA
jgi:hypothetical protein